MKSTRYIIGLFVAGLCAIAACDNLDYPDRHVVTDAKPVIYSVRYAAEDTYLEQAFMDEIICILGKNLNSVTGILFNDQPAILNTSYMTDNTIIVSVPKTMPKVKTDKIYLLHHADTVSTFPFMVLPPVANVTSMDCEMLKPGSVATIYGNYFYDTDDIPMSIEFPNAMVTDIKEMDMNHVTFTIPAAAQPGKVKVYTASGTAQSNFMYLDDRGMLFDFDGGTGLGADHGWHARVITTDAEAITGNYVQLGDGSSVLTNWNDSQYSFEYWCGSWDDPQNITSGAGIALNNLVDFSNFANMCLKFEICIPEDKPWCDFPMQICFEGVDKVTQSGNPIPGFAKVAAANAYAFNGEGGNGEELYGRAHYSPWKSTGSFHTGGKWTTVTIPFTDFTLNKDGGPADTKPSSAADFASLTMFITGPSTTGTECAPVIKIDNIRAVPVK